MITLSDQYKTLLMSLGKEYQRLNDIYKSNAPLYGTIPAGGGEWMDSFFRMEAIRGCTSALSKGESIEDAIVAGKEASTDAVRIWNSRREYQVRRWDGTSHSWLENLVYRMCRECGIVE